MLLSMWHYIRDNQSIQLKRNRNMNMYLCGKSLDINNDSVQRRYEVKLICIPLYDNI